MFILVLATLAPTCGMAQEIAPFRRVLIDPERLPQELERVKQGRLQVLSREEFEELVRKAGEATALLRNPPRLAETRYQAVLSDQALIGVAHWQLSHAAQGPTLLALPSFNLALRQPPRQGTKEVALGDLDGKTTALLLQETGATSAIDLLWSRAGETRSDGITFELRLPACAVASLDLVLPPAWVVSVPERVMLTGPTPLPRQGEPARQAVPPTLVELLKSEAALAQAVPEGSRLWTIHSSGKDRLLFTLRQADRQGPVRVLVNRQLTTQKLLPDGLEATYELDLDSLNQGFRDLVCELDPGLRPYEVSLRNLINWEFQPGAGPDLPSKLVLHLKESIHEGTLKVSCLAPLRPVGKPGDPVAWTSPALRVSQAVPRGENLVLRVHPEVRLERWQAQGFRLRETGTETDSDGIAGWQRLVLEGGGIIPEGNQPGDSPRSLGVRPTATIRPHAVEFRARQLAWWQVGSNRHTLTLQIDYQVEVGRLFQLPVELPANWDVERIEMSPASAQASWQPPRDGKQRLLLVDLNRPLSMRTGKAPDADAPGPHGTLTVVLSSTASRLQDGNPKSQIPNPKSQIPKKTGDLGFGDLGIWDSPGGGNPPRRTFALPEATPRGAAWREGALAISLNPLLQLTASNINPTPAEPGEDGPWGRVSPDLFIPYRDQVARGTISVALRPPQLRSRVLTSVFLGRENTMVDSRISLEVEAGSVETIDLIVTGNPGSSWTWRGEANGRGMIRAERLFSQEALAAATLIGLGWGAPTLALAPVAIPGQRWRITLSRPLRAGETVELTGTTQLPLLPGSVPRWTLPLLEIPAAHRAESEVLLYLGTNGLLEIEAAGLQEVPGPKSGRAGDSPRSLPVWRAFRHGQRTGFLEVHGPLPGSEPASPAATARVSLARLALYLGPDGTLEHHAAFTLTGWSESTLPVQLPDQSRLLAVAINGKWLNTLPPQDGESAAAMLLPVPSTGASNTAGVAPLPGWPEHRQVRYELVYLRPVPSWWLWTTLTADFPTLPIMPSAIATRWRLPAEMQVLHENPKSQIPNPKSQNLLSFLGFGIWDLGFPATTTSGIRPWVPSTPEARRELARDPGTLYDQVDRLVGITARDRRFLVLDTLALSESGLSPASQADPTSGEGAVLPLDRLGLTTVQLASAVVLTSKERVRTSLEEAETWEPQLIEARSHGTDRSGRFLLAIDWLTRPQAEETVRPANQESLLDPAGTLPSWVEVDGGIRLLVVRGPLNQGLALGLTLALLGLTIRRSWRSRRRQVGFLLLWLGLAGLAWLWLPPVLAPLALFPLVAGLGLVVVGYLLFLVLPGPQKAASKAPSVIKTASGAVAPVVGTAVLLLVVGIVGGQPAAPGPVAPATVYLLPADEPGSGRVLAPPELLDQLRASQRPFLPGPENTGILLSARYQARVVETTVHVEAVFTAITFNDDATLILPLENVYLTGLTWLDDGRVNVQPAEKTRDRPAGYSIKIKERGSHKIEMHFEVPITALTNSSQDRALRVTLPRVAASRLRFQAPPGAASVLALNPVGWQHVTPGQGPQAGPLLEADLGALDRPLQINWFQDKGAENKTGRVYYQEAYLWDLRGDAGSLTGLIHYRVSAGTVRSLKLHLPAGLEVRNVEAFRAVMPRGPVLQPLLDGSIRLERWQIQGEGKDRTLVLQFQSPITGDLGVSLDMVPRAAIPALYALPLPAPQGEPLPGPGYLAYHAQGLEVTRSDLLVRLTAIKAADFAPFWPLSSRPPPHSLQFCTEFRREGSQPPLLQLRLGWQVPPLQAKQEVILQIGPTQCEAQARLELTASGKDLSLVEVELGTSAWRVTAVSGSDVRSWSQADSRLSVWLERSCILTRLEITGFLPLAGSGGGDLELPRLHTLGAASVRTTLSISADVGIQLTPLTPQQQKEGNLTEKTAPSAQPATLEYESRHLNYGGRIHYVTLSGATVRAGASRLLTLIEVVDRRLQISTSLVYRLRRGEIRTIQVRLRDWPGPAPEVFPADLNPKAVALGPGDWSLAIDLPSGTDRLQSLTIRGSERMNEEGERRNKDGPSFPPSAFRLHPSETWLPSVTVQGLGHTERWVALAGRDVESEKACDLTAVALPAVMQTWQLAGLSNAWAREAERLWRVGGQVWHQTGPSASLRLLLCVPKTEEAPRILLSEQEAGLTKDQQFWHEGAWWLAAAGRGELVVDLPANGRILTATVDGIVVAPLQQRPRSWWLPLPGSARVRQVRLTWQYDTGREKPTRPLLDMPTLQGTLPGPILWTLHLPSHLVPKPGSTGLSLQDGRDYAALLALYRARTQARILADLDPRGGMDQALSPRQTIEGKLAFWRRTAELNLDLTEDSNLQGPEGQTLAEWLAQIKTGAGQALPSSPEFKATGTDGDGFTCDHTYRGVSLNAPPPVVTLHFLDNPGTLAMLALSAEWSLLLLVGWLVSLISYARRLARLLWPEQLALVGALICLTGTWTAGVIGIALAILCRLGTVLRRHS